MGCEADWQDWWRCQKGASGASSKTCTWFAKEGWGTMTNWRVAGSCGSVVQITHSKAENTQVKNRVIRDQWFRGSRRKWSGIWGVDEEEVIRHLVEQEGLKVIFQCASQGSEEQVELEVQNCKLLAWNISETRNSQWRSLHWVWHGTMLERIRWRCAQQNTVRCWKKNWGWSAIKFVVSSRQCWINILEQGLCKNDVGVRHFSTVSCLLNSKERSFVEEVREKNRIRFGHIEWISSVEKWFSTSRQSRWIWRNEAPAEIKELSSLICGSEKVRIIEVDKPKVLSVEWEKFCHRLTVGSFVSDNRVFVVNDECGK